MTKSTSRPPKGHHDEHGSQLADKTVMPPLEPIDFAKVGARAPRPVRLDRSPADPLPRARAVVLTWTTAEWAALSHVFCGSGRRMPYDIDKGPSWQKHWMLYRRGYRSVLRRVPPQAPSRTQRAWGSYRLVSLSPDEAPVLLLKSDMHVSTDGPTLPLEELLRRVLDETGAELILTIGTAGGAALEQSIGTVVVSSVAQLCLTGEFADLPYRNQLYQSRWQPDPSLLGRTVKRLFLKTPVRLRVLRDLADRIDEPLRRVLNPTIERARIERRAELHLGLEQGARTGPIRPVLTTNGYGVATTAGDYAEYCCLEMDDGLVARAAAQAGADYASVRNISDPVVNAGLSTKAQQDWSFALYTTYGLYTSLNGALAAWSLLHDAPGPG